MPNQDLNVLLQQVGAARFAPIAPQRIPFDGGALVSCRMNQCGCYGKRWSCPPAVRGHEEWEQLLHSRAQAIVFQADYPYADIFDYASMEAGAKEFYALCRRLETSARKLNSEALVLGAGACRECRKCTYPDAPCVRDQGPVLSMEACGINVTKLCEEARLPYLVADDMATYTGLLLL